MRAYFEMFAKTFDFGGRTSRKQFWIAQLFNFIFCVLFCFLALPFASDLQLFETAITALEGIYVVIVFLPVLAICCRRFRDAGFSPYLVLLALIPVVGEFIVLCFLCLPTKTSNENIFINKNNEPVNQSQQKTTQESVVTQNSNNVEKKPSASQKIALLQKMRNEGKISNETYQNEILKILSK